MNQRLPKTQRQALLLLVCLVFVGACAKAPSSGVNVKALTAKLVFGVPPLVPPPATLADSPELEEDFLPIPPVRGPKPLPPPPPKVPCPKADPSKADAQPSDIPEKVLPKIGLYRWKVAGYEFHPGRQVPVTKVGSFIERKVIDVALLEGDYDFTYSVVGRQPNFNGSVKKLVFKVDRDVDNASDVAGIFLTQIVDRPGTVRESILNLNPAIPMLRLPVKGGDRIDAQSVSNVDFGVLKLTGLVLGKARRVDACGTNIDAWNVDATLEVTQDAPSQDSETPEANPPVTTTFDFDYSFSMNLGGLLVFQHIEAPPCPIDATKTQTPGDGSDEQQGQERRPGSRDEDANPDVETGMFRCEVSSDYYEYDLGIGQLIPNPLPSATP